MNITYLPNRPAAQVELENYRVLIDWTPSRTQAYPRIYGPSVAPDMEMPPFSIKGEDADVDALWRKYNREEVLLMKEEILKAAAELAEDPRTEYLAAAMMEIRFSRTAGCSCACSPGFISKLSPYFRDRNDVSKLVNHVSVIKK